MSLQFVKVFPLSLAYGDGRSHSSLCGHSVFTLLVVLIFADDIHKRSIGGFSFAFCDVFFQLELPSRRGDCNLQLSTM